MVIITATIASIATITVVVFISVYLPVDSGIFPREQVASINLRSLGFTIFAVLNNAAFCKSSMNFLSQSFNLFDVTPRAPITNGTTATCDKSQIFLFPDFLFFIPDSPVYDY